MNSLDEFISALRINEKMNAVVTEFMNEWGKEYPPTLLFSTLGKPIANNENGMGKDELINIFMLIESAINSPNSQVKNCIATGLLEALYSRSNSIKNWDKLSHFIKESSKKYLDQWIAT